jgi:hypothetical protein
MNKIRKRYDLTQTDCCAVTCPFVIIDPQNKDEDLEYTEYFCERYKHKLFPIDNGKLKRAPNCKIVSVEWAFVFEE